MDKQYRDLLIKLGLNPVYLENNFRENDAPFGYHPTMRCSHCGGPIVILDVRCVDECELEKEVSDGHNS